MNKQSNTKAWSKQSKAKPSQAKQSQAEQSKAKQSKAKQSQAKPSQATQFQEPPQHFCSQNINFLYEQAKQHQSMIEAKQSKAKSS